MRVTCPVLLSLMLLSGPVLASMATFVPDQIDDVIPGTDVTFQITVAVESLGGFNGAD
ncbi:unnamed protein product, partial [marine sediment metagenome]